MIIVFFAIGIFSFTKTKFKLKDVFFVFGFILFSFMAKRNFFFLTLIGLIYLTNMIRDFINTYIGEEVSNSFYKMIENSKYIIIVICCFISIISIKNLSYEHLREYVSDFDMPKEATEWILENVDYKNMRIWNSFNWGSYLELNGIKVLLDSRSGMYTEEENKGCTVLSDWNNVTEDNVDYKDIFKKYEITHILVENNEKLNKNIQKDDDYELIYSDNLFSLYEKSN